MPHCHVAVIEADALSSGPATAVRQSCTILLHVWALSARPCSFAVGDCVKARRAFSDADVRQFAVLSGDTNAIHLDEAYAAQSRFGRRVVHGILLSSMFSGLVGSRCARWPSVCARLTKGFVDCLDQGQSTCRRHSSFTAPVRHAWPPCQCADTRASVSG